MTPGLKPLVTVVICTRNEDGYIGRCLDSLLEGTYPLERVHIVVCDGRSTDRTRVVLEEYARRHPCIEWIDNPGLTAPIGFNLGIRAARGDYIAILSAHATAAPDWIEQNVKALEEHPTADGVGGHMITQGQGRWGEAIAAALSTRFGVGDNSFRVGGRAGWVDTVVFGAYRRRTFARFGMFDEELTRNQDDEFNYRINGMGGRLWFTPAIRTTYYSRSSPGQLYRQYAQYGYWKPLVLKKCPGIFRWRQFVPSLFVLTWAGVFLLGLVWRPAWVFLIVILALYTVASVTASLFAARGKVGLFWSLPLVFVIVHYAYGVHFLWGALCLVLGRKPKPRHCEPTRAMAGAGGHT